MKQVSKRLVTRNVCNTRVTSKGRERRERRISDVLLSCYSGSDIRLKPF